MNHKRLMLIFKLCPIMIPFLVLFGSGIFLTLLQSLGFFTFQYHYEDHLFAYKTLLSDQWFYQSFFFTLFVAFMSAFLSIIVGTFFSYHIWKLPLKWQNSTIVYKIPLILPHIAAAFIVLVLFSKTGLISSLMYHLKMINGYQEFPNILYHAWGLDIIGAYLFKEVPFVILMVTAILNKLDKKIIVTARMMGAKNTLIFFKIILPFILPVIHTTFIILFIYSFGAFDIPYVLGSSYPGMLSIKVFQYYFERDLAQRPIAMAILSLIFLFSMLFIYLYSKFMTQINIEERSL